MGDNNVVAVADRRALQLILIDAGDAVGREQSLVLSHTQRLTFLSRQCPVLGKQLSVGGKSEIEIEEMGGGERRQEQRRSFSNKKKGKEKKRKRQKN